MYPSLPLKMAADSLPFVCCQIWQCYMNFLYSNLLPQLSNSRELMGVPHASPRPASSVGPLTPLLQNVPPLPINLCSALYIIVCCFFILFCSFVAFDCPSYFQTFPRLISLRYVVITITSPLQDFYISNGMIQCYMLWKHYTFTFLGINGLWYPFIDSTGLVTMT